MGKDIEQAMTEGIVFKKAPEEKNNVGKVKTKAKKKSYITGQHHSASAKMKADIRRKRANRNS